MNKIAKELIRIARELTATGEMSRFDIQPGGEHYGWAREIEDAAKEIQQLTGQKARFRQMRPFDVYQGPYAYLNIGKLWSSEGGDYALELGSGFIVDSELRKKNTIVGSPDDIADVLNEKYAHNASDGSERVAFGEVPVVQADPRMARLSTMTLSEIASLIYDDHRTQGRQVNYAAKPYLEAMTTLQHIDDNYFQDTGSSVVAYLLGNLTSWKGDVARAVKKELNRRLR